MTDFDYATRKASSLDNANTPCGAHTIDEKQCASYADVMAIRDTIMNKLNQAFLPESLKVQDESHLHEGHAGHRPGGETHFRLYIVSRSFEGKSRIERHRMINAALACELAGPVHALAIHAQAPGEGGNR